jgi:hypothetical protein
VPDRAQSSKLREVREIQSLSRLTDRQLLEIGKSIERSKRDVEILYMQAFQLGSPTKRSKVCGV